jgi:hypothetical protein
MRGNQNSLKMSAHNPKVDDMKADEARLREGAVAKAQLEQKIAEAKKELERMSTQLERWEQATRVNKANPMAHNSSSEVEAIPVRTGPISATPIRAPTSACVITSNPEPTPLEIPRTDAHGEEAFRTLKLPPGFGSHSQQTPNKMASTMTGEETAPHVPYVGAHQPTSLLNRANILLEESEKNKEVSGKLRHLNREILTIWADSCAEQGGQVINLTLEVYEFLRPNTWMGEICNEHVEKINGKLGELEGLKKQFSKDQLNARQNYYEALKIQSDMNAELIEALGTIRCMVLYSEPGITSDEEQEGETSGPDRGPSIDRSTLQATPGSVRAQRRTWKSCGHAVLSRQTVLGRQRMTKEEVTLKGASKAVARYLLQVVTDHPAGTTCAYSDPRGRSRVRFCRV